MTRPEIVVVTGATAGAGRATVREFARRGAHVALLARGAERLAAAAREVEALGGVALPLQTDVADATAVRAAAATAEAELGPIDIWINNAMATVFGRVVDMRPEELRRVTDVTYHGVAYGTMAALEHMIPRNRGTIVQVGSALAYRSIPLQAAYCAAKHAIIGFTDSLRSELIHDRVDIHLTVVELPALNTPQFDWCKSYMPRRAKPVPPIYQPEVAARAIYYAAHHHRREVRVGYSTSEAIYGQNVIPGALDHYLAAKAVKGQQTADEEDPTRPYNLWEPVSGDHAAHGRFDAEATDSYRFTSMTSRLGAGGVRLGVGALGVGAIVAGTLMAMRLLRRQSCDE